MNILFVEHDRQTRRLVKDMLIQAGATLTEVGDTAGLRALGSEMPALALVEVMADGMGLAAIARLHQRQPQRPAILALAVDAALEGPCREAGADEVLVDPAPLTALFDAIVRHLPTEGR